MAPSGVVFYHGPSVLAPSTTIVGVATFRSMNRKTSWLVQTWVLCADVAPPDALKSGQDAAICGDCPLRPGEHGRGCYVHLLRGGPFGVWKAWRAGNYPCLSKEHHILFEGRRLRGGAYGDPVAIPVDSWERYWVS